MTPKSLILNLAPSRTLMTLPTFSSLSFLTCENPKNGGSSDRGCLIIEISRFWHFKNQECSADRKIYIQVFYNVFRAKIYIQVH
jgi:hypothetical protein